MMTGIDGGHPLTLRPLQAEAAPTVGDLASMDIQDVILLVQLQRTKGIDDQVRNQMADMTARNERIKELNTAYAKLRELLPSGEKGTVKFEENVKKLFAENPGLEKVLQDAGIDLRNAKDKDGKPKTEWSKGEWDAIMGSVKTVSDNLNTTSQMDMIRLQSLMDKRSQSFDMMTNTLSKFSKNLDSIIGNLR